MGAALLNLARRGAASCRARVGLLVIGWGGLLLAGCASAPPAGAPTWVAAWGSAQLVPTAPSGAPLWRTPMHDVSLRQIARVSTGGTAVRVRVSNLFGDEPLQLGAASVARLSGLEPAPSIDAVSLRPLRFAGQREVVVPPHAELWSDPVDFPVAAGADVAVQWHVRAGPAQPSAHPGSRIRSWALPGDHADAVDWPQAQPVEGWWHLAALDVSAATPRPVLVATGDSITDGYGVPSGSYARWTDVLTRRLIATARDAAVVNTGIGGGRLLREGAGPSLLARFERDVLARSGVTHAVVLIGVNDLGTSHRGQATTPASRAALRAEMQAGFADLVRRARAQGVCLIVSTVMPYGGSGYYAPQPENEAERQALNAWLREPGRFDAVLDFDALMRDPARPSHLRAEVDNDGLHPSLAGYRVMADAFPLGLLDRRCAPAVSGR
jgi:lysophospholipase L1-like esterase